jgi:hypothetical protein
VLNVHPVWVSGRNRDMAAAYAAFLDAIRADEALRITTPSALRSMIVGTG